MLRKARRNRASLAPGEIESYQKRPAVAPYPLTDFNSQRNMAPLAP
jgi:hypothetical protein